MKKRDVFVVDYCRAHGLDPKRIRERFIANSIQKVGGRWLVNATTRPFLYETVRRKK
jgi:hypothetical protein